MKTLAIFKVNFRIYVLLCIFVKKQGFNSFSSIGRVKIFFVRKQENFRQKAAPPIGGALFFDIACVDCFAFESRIPNSIVCPSVHWTVQSQDEKTRDIDEWSELLLFFLLCRTVRSQVNFFSAAPLQRQQAVVASARFWPTERRSGGNKYVDMLLATPVSVDDAVFFLPTCRL